MKNKIDKSSLFSLSPILIAILIPVGRIIFQKKLDKNKQKKHK